MIGDFLVIVFFSIYLPYQKQPIPATPLFYSGTLVYTSSILMLPHTKSPVARSTLKWHPTSPTPNCNSSSTKDSHKTRLPDVPASPAQHSEGDCKHWVHLMYTLVYQIQVHLMCTRVHKRKSKAPTQKTS